MTTTTVLLSRELRFGVHPGLPPVVSPNSFAGQPALLGMGPFFTLRATVSGAIDPATGMLMNIKQIDQILRDTAVPHVAAYWAETGVAIRGGGNLLLNLATLLADHFKGPVLKSLELSLSPYLRISHDLKEPRMVHVTQRFEFSAAHRLHSAELSPEKNREVFGKCNNANGHGHNYEFEVTVAGEPDAKTGAVVPIEELQLIVNTHVVDVFDHKHLNQDCPEFARLNPTVENIARVIYERLEKQFKTSRLRRVRVWETPKTSSEYPAV